MLLGLLLPVLLGFALAKTEVASKQTKRAASSVSHKLHLPKVEIKSRQDTAAEDSGKVSDAEKVVVGDVPVDPDTVKAENAEPPPDRKFLGIF